MNHFEISLVVFACVFGSALAGMMLHKLLPPNHLTEESIGVIKLATGLIATMAALVLGLLVSSAKVSFDTEGTNLVHNAANVVRLDRALANYGPETRDIRTALKRTYAETIRIMDSGDSGQLARLGSAEAIDRTETFERSVERLTPGNASQGRLRMEALALVHEILGARWLSILQAHGSIPVSLLAILILWLSIIFGTFGMFAPRNGTIIAAFVVCAVSTSGAVFLIEELSTPLDGVARVSVVPMRTALSLLGQ